MQHKGAILRDDSSKIGKNRDASGSLVGNKKIKISLKEGRQK
jgi:hypothetical protein